MISERVGASVYLKLEGANPTGSFKDRGMTLAVSRAKGGGAEAIICASTGNTAASAAAYAARAGLRGAVIVPEGRIAIGKLAQALIHGARATALRANFDEALRSSASWPPSTRSSSSTRSTRTGRARRRPRSRSQPRRAARRVMIPVGNAGNVTAWRGFSELGTTLCSTASRSAARRHRARGAGGEPGDRLGDPDRQPSAVEEAMAAFTLAWEGRGRHRRPDPGRTGRSPRARASSGARPRPRSPASSRTACRSARPGGA